jgi:hypothetical protein
VPRIATTPLRPHIALPDLLGLSQSQLLAKLHDLILVDNLHDLLFSRLSQPKLLRLDGGLLDRLENGVCDLAVTILSLIFLRIELVAYTAIAVEEGAQVDAAAFAETVGVVG